MQSTQPSLDPLLFASEKMKEFQEVEALIERLRSRLLAAEHRRTVIEGELASSYLTRKGIQNLPPELLCMIFSLIDETQRERNGQLARVSKSWRTLVNGTLQFWTHILVEWNGSARSLIQSWCYMDLCIQRSNSLFLDVTVDFGSMPTFGYYIWDLINRHFDQIEPQNLLYSSEEDDAQQLTLLLGEHCHKYDSLIANTIRKICDTELSRCRSLKSSLPYHIDGVDGILSNITSEAPLTKLEYHKLGFSDDPATVVTHLPPLRSLKHLETNQYVDLHPTALSTLEHLDLASEEASSHFLIHGGSCFSSLRFLSILLWEGVQLQGTLFFPSLHTLKLQGDGQEIVMPVLDAPVLDTLYLYRTRLPQYTNKSIPSLKSLSLRVNSWNDNHIPAFMVDLRNALPWFPNLVSCSLLGSTQMCCPVSEVIARVIKDTRADGAALKSLERINIVEVWAGPPKLYREVDMLLCNTGAEGIL